MDLEMFDCRSDAAGGVWPAGAEVGDLGLLNNQRLKVGYFYGVWRVAGDFKAQSAVEGFDYKKYDSSRCFGRI